MITRVMLSCKIYVIFEIAFRLFIFEIHGLHERKWETVPEYSETKYDPNSGKWNYEPKDKVEYNLFQLEWKFDSEQGN